MLKYFLKCLQAEHIREKPWEFNPEIEKKKKAYVWQTRS